MCHIEARQGNIAWRPGAGQFRLAPSTESKSNILGAAPVRWPRIRRRAPRQTVNRRPSRGRTNRLARARSAAERMLHSRNCSRSPHSGLGSRFTCNTHVSPDSGRGGSMPGDQSESRGGICRLRSSILSFYPSRRPAAKAPIVLLPAALDACPDGTQSIPLVSIRLAEIVRVGCWPLG